MSDDLRITPILNDIYARLINAGVPAVYRPTAQNPLPEVLPPAFVALHPLGGPIDAQWGQRRGYRPGVRAICCAHGPGTAHELLQTIGEALPEGSPYEVTSVGFENTSSTHTEIPVTIYISL